MTPLKGETLIQWQTVRESDKGSHTWKRKAQHVTRTPKNEYAKEMMGKRLNSETTEGQTAMAKKVGELASLCGS